MLISPARDVSLMKNITKRWITSSSPHVGRSCVSDVRVVRPYNDFGVAMIISGDRSEVASNIHHHSGKVVISAMMVSGGKSNLRNKLASSSSS